MTEHERWIVYPLLCLALGASLKEKLVPPQIIDATKLECHDLKASRILLVDEHQHVRIVLGSVADRAGRASVGAAESDTRGEIELFGGRGAGRPLAMIGLKSELQLIVAKAIVVVDQLNKPRVEIGSGPLGNPKQEQPPLQTTGIVQLSGPGDRPLVVLRSNDKHGGVIAVSRSGQPEVTLSAEPEGGIVELWHAPPRKPSASPGPKKSSGPKNNPSPPAHGNPSAGDQKKADSAAAKGDNGQKIEPAAPRATASGRSSTPSAEKEQVPPP